MPWKSVDLLAAPSGRDEAEKKFEWLAFIAQSLA